MNRSRHSLTYKISAIVLILCLLSTVSAMKAGEREKIYTGLFGLWAWGNWPSAFEMVEENGFDIAIGVNKKELLDEAQARGIKCIVTFGLKKDMADDREKWSEFLAKLEAKILELKDHPAVFAWYVVDEPDLHGIAPGKIKIIRDLVLSLDNTKPIFTVLAVPDRWASYLPYFDIIAIDPYLREPQEGTYDTPEKVGDWIMKMRSDLKSAGMDKPVWVVLGAFELRPRSPSSDRSPFRKITPAEFNEMTNIALEEKADAVLVYTLSFKNVEGYKDWKLPQDDVLLWEAVKKIPGKVKAVQEKR